MENETRFSNNDNEYIEMGGVILASNKGEEKRNQSRKSS